LDVVVPVLWTRWKSRPGSIASFSPTGKIANSVVGSTIGPEPKAETPLPSPGKLSVVTSAELDPTVWSRPYPPAIPIPLDPPERDAAGAPPPARRGVVADPLNGVERPSRTP